MHIFTWRLMQLRPVVSRKKCGLSEVVAIEVRFENTWPAHIANATRASSGAGANSCGIDWVDDSVRFVVVEEALPARNRLADGNLVQSVRTSEFGLGDPVHCRDEAIFRGRVRVVELQFWQVDGCYAGWGDLKRGANARPNAQGAQLGP